MGQKVNPHGLRAVSYTHLDVYKRQAHTNTINVYDILKYNTVITTKAAVATIEEVYA